MKRSELEHVLRASKSITGETEFVIIGSQAILGRFPDAPRSLRESMEADIYPRLKPELSDLIEGSIGRYSRFQQEFGYFADGVGPETAKLPSGWEDRLIAVSNLNTDGATGWCLGPHDLAFSKLAASREKDLAFVTELLLHKMIRPSIMERLINDEQDAAVQEKLRRALRICTERLRKKRNE